MSKLLKLPLYFKLAIWYNGPFMWPRCLDLYLMSKTPLRTHPGHIFATHPSRTSINHVVCSCLAALLIIFLLTLSGRKKEHISFNSVHTLCAKVSFETMPSMQWSQFDDTAIKLSPGNKPHTLFRPQVCTAQPVSTNLIHKVITCTL